MMAGMSWWRRFFNGLLSKDKSLATGLILGFMAWTLLRLVDNIAANGTIEYAIANSPATLADGRSGYLIRVTLTNLLGMTRFPIANLGDKRLKFNDAGAKRLLVL